ncbi:MAG: twin-arginine translocase subunit TatC [Bacteroidetes bacterium]|jgi:sec-independent protein translocase protein TatC|nr:twin-arginine translocase subunit TatC [Bacteroidota bacterium]
MAPLGTPDAAASEAEGREMSFFDHLEELRWSVVKAVIGILIGTIACSIYADVIVNTVLLGPLRAVGLSAQVLSPYGIIVLYMETVLVCGFIVSMPNTLWWLWRFVAPGLLPTERRYISKIVFFTTLCFFAGVAFAYFVVLPTALSFFATFGTENIDLNIATDQYIGFVLALLAGAGLVFELPMITYFLAKMGLLTPAFMRKYRRHAIVGILVVSALITPTPDIVTQVLLAAPMLVLYEASIFVAAASRKKDPSEAAS